MLLTLDELIAVTNVFGSIETAELDDDDRQQLLSFERSINKLLQAIPITKKQRPEILHFPESQPEVLDIDNEDVVNTVEDDVAPENEPSYETGPTNKLDEASENDL